jgi:histidine ammonia-lyase
MPADPGAGRIVGLDGRTLSLDDVEAGARGARVTLSPAARERIERARAMVQRILQDGRIVYGISTGVGDLCTTTIPPGELRALQQNIIRSHAAGVGAPLPESIVRAMLLLRANALAAGHSGVRTELIERLLALLNGRVHPVIPEQGSLGASGDLAPLAHLALVLTGEGEATVDGVRLPGREALRRRGLDPIPLEAKEGMALINGTQLMSAIGIRVVLDGERLAALADVAGALTLEALRGTDEAFAAALHAVRPYAGQSESAAHLRRLLEGSERVSRGAYDRIQDAYSLRCIPQVHGAVRQALSHLRDILSIEINSATDNPLLFPDSGDVISGGNFHGQPLALPLDYAGCALATLAGISERRIERLVNPHLSGLPAFLAPKGGLQSGYMLAQYTAAALVSENKVLSHPASVDSIPTSGNQEDHVSMGAAAARKTWQILRHAQQVLGIELVVGCQAVDFGCGRLGRGTAAAYRAVRERVERLTEDRPLAADLAEGLALVVSGAVLDAAEAAVSGRPD